MAEIQQALGDGVVVTEEKNRLRLVAVVEEASRSYPESFPDGAQASDQFVDYGFGYLQVRDGVLVNFNPREYDEPFVFTYLSP